MAGKGVERKAWVDDVEVSAHLWNSLELRRLPEPDLEATEPKSIAMLHPSSAGALPRRCTTCWY